MTDAEYEYLSRKLKDHLSRARQLAEEQRLLLALRKELQTDVKLLQAQIEALETGSQ